MVRLPLLLRLLAIVVILALRNVISLHRNLDGLFLITILAIVLVWTLVSIILIWP